MIEVIANENSEITEKGEPVITDQLALAAVGVIKEYCESIGHCKSCILGTYNKICDKLNECPKHWNI